MPVGSRWVTPKTYFRKIRMPLLLYRAVSSSLVFGLIYLFTIMSLESGPGDFSRDDLVTILFFSIFFPFIIFYLFSNYAAVLYEARHFASLDGFFIKCKWCTSPSDLNKAAPKRVFPHEIWKTIVRFLEKTEEVHELQRTESKDDFSLLASLIPDFHLSRFQAISLRWGSFYPFSPSITINLPDKGIHICLFSLPHWSLKWNVWIFLGTTSGSGSSQVDEQYFASLKTHLETIVKNIPQENPFCNICIENRLTRCYFSGSGSVYYKPDDFFDFDPFETETILLEYTDRKRLIKKMF